jgi:hypothetical protein
LKLGTSKQNQLFSILTVSDEQELIKLITKAILFGIKHTVFREPDIGNEITAVAFEPSDAARKLTSLCSLLEGCLTHQFKRTEIILHFNKCTLRCNIPMWVVKAKGQTYYVNHVDMDSGIGFNKETQITLRLRAH